MNAKMITINFSKKVSTDFVYSIFKSWVEDPRRKFTLEGKLPEKFDVGTDLPTSTGSINLVDGGTIVLKDSPVMLSFYHTGHAVYIHMASLDDNAELHTPAIVKNFKAFGGVVEEA